MYSKKLCSAASRWLRVRMWLHALLLQVSEERDHPLAGQIIERQARDRAVRAR
jgi:hypothetical protein